MKLLLPFYVPFDVRAQINPKKLWGTIFTSGLQQWLSILCAFLNYVPEIIYIIYIMLAY